MIQVRSTTAHPYRGSCDLLDARRSWQLVSASVVLFGMVGCSSLLFPSPAPTRPAPRVGDAARLRSHVETLAAQPRTGTALEQAARYILGQLEGLSVVRQPVGESVNLVVRFGDLEKRLIVGAHYDSVPTTPGADDNASGVAVLIEVARALAGRDDLPPVEVVFYTYEEPPWFRTELMGSAVHAASVDPNKVRGMISVEMVGYFDDTPGSQTFPSALMLAGYPDVGNFLAVVGRTDDADLVDEAQMSLAVSDELRIFSAKLPVMVEGLDFSDHLNYWARGIPAAMVTDTAFLRNFEYHRGGDTPDRLDYDRMALVVDGLVRLIVEAE